MSDKTISEKAKEALNPILNGYTKLLFDGLVSDGVLTVNANGDKHIYELSIDAPLEQKANANFTSNEASVIGNFQLFSDVIKNTYYHLQYGESDKKPLSEIVDAFQQRDVFKMPGLNVDRMKDLLDKNKSLMNDEEIQKDAIRLFTEQQVNFSGYISQVLEFYTLQKAKEIFQDFSLEKPEPNSIASIVDLIARSKNSQSDYDMLFEIEFRKKPLETLKEDIVKAFDHLSRYNNQTKSDNWIVMVLFSDEGSTATERIEYKFKQLMDEMFPDQAVRILFTAVQTGNLHFINEEFKKILQKVISTTSSNVEFRFFNQSALEEFLEIDDHYYDRILNLDVSSFYISVTPQSKIDHWRLGLKFSSSGEFPDRTLRHGSGYPIFHLEKNKDNPTLLVSYYDKTGSQAFASTTKLTDYTNQQVRLIVSKKAYDVKIDVTDSNGESILNGPQIVSGDYRFAKVFAWGDNRNPFEIRALIEEHKVSAQP